MLNWNIVRKSYVTRLNQLLVFVTIALVGCGDGGAPPSAGGATTSASSLQLSTVLTSVPSDNSGSTTITVTALDGSNAALSGIVISLSTDTGIVSAPTVTTGAGGTATFTFRSGTASLANRTATITASAGATAQIPIQIAGSTLTIFSTTGSSVPNDGSATVAITFLAKNAQNTGLASIPFTASWVTTSGGQVSLDTTTGTTDAAGKFTITVTGTSNPATGTATVSATAAGSTVSATVNVTAAAATFGISQTSNSTGPVVTLNPTTVAMRIGEQLTVTVTAPSGTSNVQFNTSQGTWSGSAATAQTVAVAGGVASAILNQTVAGVANVQVSDPANTSLSDNLVVGVTAVTANKIALTASPTVVPKTTGSTTGTSTLVARVLDANNQPVGNAPVEFSISNTTGGGENVSPVVAYTAAISGGGVGLGEARATFTSGSLSSSAQGVQVRAKVSNTAVQTGTAPSTADASIVIGGTAGSIAIGLATKLVEVNSTTYKLPVSVLVSDASGNAQANQTVSLSLWPIAWSTGVDVACTPDANDNVSKGTFYNEDRNENLILDNVSVGVPEDGYRKYYSGGALATGAGTLNGLITPINSAAGSIPASITTDTLGVGNFDLIYLKSSAIYTVVRLRASTVVQGTETVSEKIFVLPAATSDVTPCAIQPPYIF